MFAYFSWKSFWCAMFMLLFNPVGIIVMVMYPIVFWVALVCFLLSLIFIKEWD